MVGSDGSSHRTHPEAIGSPTYYTDTFWRYSTATRRLEMPNGWVLQYDTGAPANAAAWLEYVEDPFGNRLTAIWGAESGQVKRLTAVVQSVRKVEGNGDVTAVYRTVELAYDAGSSCPWVMPSRMIYKHPAGDRTWTYGCATDRLVSVTPPAGPGWAFAYELGDLGNDNSGTLTVTAPPGGQVRYEFIDIDLPAAEPQEVNKSVILKRSTLPGREIAGDDWWFGFDQGVTAVGWVDLPADRRLEFEHAWHAASGKWQLLRKTLREYVGAAWEFRAELVRTYQELGFLSNPVFNEMATVPATETVTQDGASYVTAFTYDTANFGDYHQPKTITEGARTTTRAFDYGFLDFDPNHGKNVTQRHLLNRVASETVSIPDSGTYTTTWGYEYTTGFVTRETRYGVATTFERDAIGNRKKATDANNHATSFTYEWGVEKDTTTPEYVIARTINPDGTVASETRDGDLTGFTYDAVGRLTQETPPAVPPALVPTVHTYSGDGSWATATRGDAFVTTTADGFGRPIGTVNAEGVKTAIEYDRAGRKAFESYPFAGTPNPILGDTFTYDALGRVTGIARPGGASVGYTYGVDALANTVTLRDENNHSTTQTWQAFGHPENRRLASVTDAADKTWTYSYTTLGGLTGVEQPDGPDRTWAYDEVHHWLTSETHPESGRIDYSGYDLVGNVTKKEWANGTTVEYRYDGNNRLTDILAGGGANDWDLFYDAWDQRTLVRNGAAPDSAAFVETDVAYAWRRPVSRTDTMGGQTFTVGYGYDTRGNLASVTYPSGRAVTYSYDDADRVTRVYQAGGPTWADTFSYHPSGALAGYAALNGTGTTITYDDRQRPDAWTSGPLSLNYDHDPAGNVTSITDARPEWTRAFCYDALDRLTRESACNAGGVDTYTYDARGNRLSHAGVTYGYEAGATDRLASDGVTTFGWDPAGNLATATTGATTQTFAYTPFHQVATATVGGAVTTYRYDGDQQRRLRIRADGVTEYFVPGPGLVPLAEYTRAPNGALQLGREFIYAGDRLMASEGVVPPVPFSGDDPVVPGGTAPDKAHINELRWQANQIRQRYGLLPVNFGPAIVTGDEVAAAHLQAVRSAVTAIAAYAWPSDAAGQPLATGQPIRAAHVNELRDRIRALQGGASRRWFYHLDAIGSVRAVTDETGGLVRRHDYGPFGTDLAPWPGADQRRFTGKDRDPETGLDYFSARYYQQGTGRFTSVDPHSIVNEAEDEQDLIAYLSNPQRWNRYSYSLANPLKFKDPDGRQAWLANAWARVVNNPQVQRMLNSGVARRVVDSPVVSQANRALQNLNNRLFDLSMKLFASPADDMAATGRGPQLTREALKSVQSLEQRLVAHRDKLEAFRSNPEAFDNLGILKNAASQEIRQRIIQGRIRHLEQEIRNFEQQIARILSGGGL